MSRPTPFPADTTPFVAQAEIDSPLGPLTALATARGLAGLWFDAQQHHPGDLDVPVDPQHRHIAAACEWLSAYWSRRPTSPLALDPQGTPFQLAVWRALMTIAVGRTSTYGEIAAQAGRPGGARAAGAAIGRNPISIIVPCHRVIGRDGSLTGYAGGLPRKQALLQLEGVLLT
jgi:methylated-DNA-[protein]-cysteine S-methyltransferase